MIEKYYEDPEAKKEAYARHMEYFLTNDITSAIPVGVAAAMEERYATEGDIDPDSINAVKTALMGPLAGLGDSLLNGTARPILAGLAISFITSDGSGRYSSSSAWPSYRWACVIWAYSRDINKV